MNFDAGNMVFLIGCVTVLLLIGGPQFTEAGFEFGAYCRKLCAWGKGGNLCKCSAVHFAGKRGEEGLPNISQEPEVLGDGGDTYYSDLPVYVEKDDEKQPKKSSLDEIREVYRQMETLDRHNGPSKTTQYVQSRLGKFHNNRKQKRKKKWWIQALMDLGGGVPGARHPLWDPILSFLHTFSPKSTCIGGPHPPNGCTPPLWKILDPPLIQGGWSAGVPPVSF